MQGYASVSTPTPVLALPNPSLHFSELILEYSKGSSGTRKQGVTNPFLSRRICVRGVGTMLILLFCVGAVLWGIHRGCGPLSCESSLGFKRFTKHRGPLDISSDIAVTNNMGALHISLDSYTPPHSIDQSSSEQP